MFNADNYSLPRLQTLANTCAISGGVLRGIGAWGAIYFFFYAANPAAATTYALTAGLPAACLDIGMAPHFRDIIGNRMRTEEHAHDENVGMRL